LPTTRSGRYEPPSGAPVHSGLAINDPRWTRPLPWTTGIANVFGLIGQVIVAGLTLVNVALPLVILRLAARRRPWTVRLLLAVPVAAAIPLTVLLAFESLEPALADPFPSSPRLWLVLGTLAGIPVLVYTATIGSSVIRRRWRALALLVGLTILASLAIGAAWLWLDMRATPAIERYDWSEWYWAVVPGAYAVGVLMSLGWSIRGIGRPLSGLGQRWSMPNSLTSR
jgi:hypothetical protein